MTTQWRFEEGELVQLLERAEERIMKLESVVRRLELELAAAEETIKTYKLGIGFYKADGSFAREVRLDGKEGEDRG